MHNFNLSPWQRHIMITVHWKLGTDKMIRDQVRDSLGRRIFTDTRVKTLEVVEGEQKAPFMAYNQRVWSGEAGVSTLDVVVTFHDGVVINTVLDQWDEARRCTTNRHDYSSTMVVGDVSFDEPAAASEMVFAAASPFAALAADLTIPPRPSRL